MQAIGMEHIRQVIKDIKSQIDIDLIEGLRIFSQLSYFLFFWGSFFSFHKCII